MTRLRIGFMGTPEFALQALKALHGAGHDVVCVYSQPPRPKGRGQKVQPSPVHAYAEKNNIPVFTPASLKDKDAQAQFAAHNLDVAIVAAYGLILPKPVLNAPKHGCLNIHASLLPRWRGASPIQQAIWKGDHETGVAIMQMDEGLDTGAVITERAVPITSRTTCGALHDELAEIGSRLVLDVVKKLETGETLQSTPQDNSKTTHAPLLTKEDGRIDWSQSAEEIDRQVRALNPWPGVWSTYEGERVKILASEIDRQTTDKPPGTVVDKTGNIACGSGTLQLTKLQPAGKQAMDFTAALNGGYVKIGGLFS